ncbi:MAG: hypothetical protein HY665_09015 [Chloroflexi bacterium]|nr:hypothetical protein [Chloroflexota bacterium]
MPRRVSKKQTPKDINELAAFIVRESTRETEPQPEKNPAAVALGRLGGRRGGLARAKKLTRERRSEIARHAALVRWRRT